MPSMAHLYHHAMAMLEMTDLTYQYGSKMLPMTGEGNVSTAPSPVASAPGELTLHIFDERQD